MNSSPAYQLIKYPLVLLQGLAQGGYDTDDSRAELPAPFEVHLYTRDWEAADIYGLKGERVFIIAHPLSSTDKLENNCYFKKAGNMLSFKHLHRVRNKPSQKCRCSLILEAPIKEPPAYPRINKFSQVRAGCVSKTEFPEAGLGWASPKFRWELWDGFEAAPGSCVGFWEVLGSVSGWDPAPLGCDCAPR